MIETCPCLKNVNFYEKFFDSPDDFYNTFLYVKGICSKDNTEKNIIFYEKEGCKEGLCILNWLNKKRIPIWAIKAINNKSKYFKIKRKRGRPRKIKMENQYANY